MESEPSSPSRASLKRGFEISEIAMVLLLVLSGLGIGISNYSADRGLWYWLLMVPVFGLTSLFVGWEAARRHGQSPGRVIVTQVLHWLGLAGALWLMVLLANTGRIANPDEGLVSLILLALATFLVGVHTDWRFAVVGAVLGGIAVLAVLVEQYLWLGIVPVLLGAGVFLYWRLRR